MIGIVGFITIATFIALYFILVRERKNSEAIKGQSELLIAYTDTIEDLYDDIRSYKHDINNILLALKYHVDEENMAGIRDVFYRDIEGIQGFDIKVYKLLAQLQNLQIDVLKGLILSKYQKAVNQGVEMEIGILTPIKPVTINDVDLCRVVGIYLDNSIEAAVESDDKIVMLFIDKVDERYMLKISNSYNKDLVPILSGKKNQSTKGVGRGMGLYSASRIIKRTSQLKNETKIEGQYYSQVLYIE